MKYIHRTIYKDKQGNISILVIFVLLAVSLIGLLAGRFIMQMMRLSSDVYVYYRTYYIARAGLETSLTVSAYRGIGFEYTVQTGASVVQDNISCDRCDFSTVLSGMSTYIVPAFWQYTGCTQDSVFVIGSGRGVVIPLFADMETGSLHTLLTNRPTYANLYTNNLQLVMHDFTQDVPHDVTLGMVSFTSDQVLYDVTLTQRYTGDNFSPEIIHTFLHSFIPIHERNTTNLFDRKNPTIQNYFFIQNSTEDDKNLIFCLTSNSKLPPRDKYAVSIGNFRDAIIALQAQLQQPIPSFLGQTYLGL